MRLNVRSLTDPQLVEAARAGNQDAASELTRRHSPKITAIARSYFVVGATHEDLVAEGLVGFVRAIHDFEPKNGMDFEPFALNCAKRMMFTALKKATRRKHGPLNTARSLSEPTSPNPESQDGMTLEEALGTRDTETAVIAIDHYRKIRTLIDTGMSRNEKAATVGTLAGASYREIASALGAPGDTKLVDNALTRARRKIRAAINLDEAA